MTIEEAIQILSQHNKWRRGDDTIEQLCPTKVGIAIDTVIEHFKISTLAADYAPQKVKDKHLRSIIMGCFITAEMQDEQWSDKDTCDLIIKALKENFKF